MQGQFLSGIKARKKNLNIGNIIKLEKVLEDLKKSAKKDIRIAKQLIKQGYCEDDPFINAVICFLNENDYLRLSKLIKLYPFGGAGDYYY